MNSTLTCDNENRYIYDTLLQENTFGHTKKVELFRNAINKLRNENKKESLRILDIGCGNGYAVTRFLGKNCDYVLGLDIYKPNIDYASTHFTHKGLHFACMDILSLPVHEKNFDIIVMADILEHVQDPETMLLTAIKLLSPDGRLLITVPNGKGPFEIEKLLSNTFIGAYLLKIIYLFIAVLNKYIFKGAWSRAIAAQSNDLPYNAESGHVQFFTKSKLFLLFRSIHLKVVNERNLSFISGPFTSTIFSPSKMFCKSNTRIVDYLPSWLSSAWFFECCKVG